MKLNNVTSRGRTRQGNLLSLLFFNAVKGLSQHKKNKMRYIYTRKIKTKQYFYIIDHSIYINNENLKTLELVIIQQGGSI